MQKELDMHQFRRKPPSSCGIDDSQELSTVINLSRIHLSKDEVNLLSRGLSFCPTPRRANKEEILDNLEGYFRHLNLKESFLDNKDNADDEVQPCFHSPSTWMPPKGGDAALKIYIKKFRTDVQQQLEANQF